MVKCICLLRLVNYWLNIDSLTSKREFEFFINKFFNEQFVLYVRHIDNVVNTAWQMEFLNLRKETKFDMEKSIFYAQDALEINEAWHKVAQIKMFLWEFLPFIAVKVC